MKATFGIALPGGKWREHSVEVEDARTAERMKLDDLDLPGWADGALSAWLVGTHEHTINIETVRVERVDNSDVQGISITGACECGATFTLIIGDEEPEWSN